MTFGKILRKFLSKRTDHTTGIAPYTSPPSESSEPRAPVPLTPTPVIHRGSPNQTIHQPLAFQSPVPQEDQGPRFFEGARGFVLNNSAIGVNQQVQFDNHSTPPYPHERTDRVDQEGGWAGLEQERSSGGLGSPSFIAHKQTVHIHSQSGRQGVLEKIQEHSIPGAMFNSDERDQPPRCHPNTRVLIRQRFKDRIENTSLRTRIIWMHGPAGVGKSAIMQTIIEDLPPQVLRGTLFFSRPNQRYDAKKAFATLAYGVAVDSPEYLRYINMRLENDPTFMKTSLDSQFKSLFITPFVDNHVKAGSQRWAMFLDGLDECQNTEDSDSQSRIFNIISDSILHYGEFTPFLWIIASRPEHNLQQAWSRIKRQFQQRTSGLWEEEIPIDSDQAARDVEVFLHTEFKKIRSDRSDSIPETLRWPSDNQFVKVAKKSSGLFVFGSTVTRYVSQGDPMARLELIISLIDRIEHPTATIHNPFYPLDSLYSRIMEDVTEDLLPAAKSLLGFYLLDTVIVRRYASGNREFGN